MSTEEKELEGLDYIAKFKERLDIVMAYINDGRDIAESDALVLWELFKIQNDGSLPFYKTICTESATTTTQTDLFSEDYSQT